MLHSFRDLHDPGRKTRKAACPPAKTANAFVFGKFNAFLVEHAKNADRVVSVSGTKHTCKYIHIVGLSARLRLRNVNAVLPMLSDIGNQDLDEQH